jgi:hypothetical protein
MTEQKAASVARKPAQTQDLPQPLRAAASVLSKVPGAGMVGRVAEGTLDKVGAVSPRGRRIAVYTGAGVLGVAGVVEWPVALTGAAVAWLTQPKGNEPQEKTGGGAAAAGGTPDVGEAGTGFSGAAEATAGVGGSRASDGKESESGATDGRTSEGVPTPQVMAEAAHGGVVPDTPSGKLPTPHSRPPGGEPGDSTTRRAGTNEH